MYFCYYENNINNPVEIPFILPKNWAFSRLADIAWLEDGVKIDGEQLPYLDVKTIRGKQTASMLSCGKVIEKGMQVILVDGENSGEVFEVPCRGYIGSTFKVLQVSYEIEKSYVKLILDFYKNLFKDNKTGSAIPHLNKKIFKSLIVAIPPVGESYRQQELEDFVFKTTIDYVLQPQVIQSVAEQVVTKFNSEITKTATLENLENELKVKEKAINSLLSVIEQGLITKSAKDRLIALETQKDELEAKISLEKAKQIKPLEVDKVKAFLTYFARKKYENGQEKNEFFNSFINRVILYDDKVLIFYNTDDNHPTVIKRKDTEELISHLNDIASNGKTATNDCQNATGNNGPVVQNKNSLEPQKFKRVSLGGALVT